MPTDTTGMNEDRALIEALADGVEHSGKIEFADSEAREQAVKQLRGIAVMCDQFELQARRATVLEDKVDDLLSKEIELWLDGRGKASEWLDGRGKASDAYDLVPAIWLLSRRTRNAGNVQAIGSAFGGIGNMLSSWTVPRPNDDNKEE